MKNSGIEWARRLVIDTSAFAWLRAGNATVLDFVATAQIVFMPATVLGELEAGFLLGQRTRENRVALSEFLEEPFVSVLPTTPEVARRYGEIFARLRKAGTPIPVNDIWIAAATVDCGGHLLTFDFHFRQVTQLSCSVLEAT